MKDDAGSTLELYSYDFARHRVRTQLGESSNSRTYYVWDGSAVIAEYVESDDSPVVPSWSRSYIYLGARLLATSMRNVDQERVQYHHNDRLGTRLVTNAQDPGYFEQATLPYGTALGAESSGATNRRFTSYDRSSITALDYAVNRYYDSAQGRFTQTDQLGMSEANPKSPQSNNLYAYVANDPVNKTDPTGLCSVPEGLRRGETGLCIEAFIAAPRIGENFFVYGHGDARTFSAFDESLTFRAQVEIVFDSETGNVAVNTKAGVSEVTFKGLEQTVGAEGTAQSEVIGTQYLDGSQEFEVSTEAVNGFHWVPLFAPGGTIRISGQFGVGDDGTFYIRNIYGTAYPSIEAYAYWLEEDGSFQIEPLIQSPETTPDALLQPMIQLYPPPYDAAPAGSSPDEEELLLR